MLLHQAAHDLGAGAEVVHLRQAGLAEAAGQHRREALLDDVLAGEDLLLLHRCLLYTSPSPRDRTRSRMPSSA